MGTINSDQFGEICNRVWADRTAVLAGRGFLSAEAALVRAVYWRLCKAGVAANASADGHTFGQTITTYRLVVECVLELNASPAFDAAPFLNKLVEGSQNEEKDTARKRESSKSGAFHL